MNTNVFISEYEKLKMKNNLTLLHWKNDTFVVADCFKSSDIRSVEFIDDFLHFAKLLNHL